MKTTSYMLLALAFCMTTSGEAQLWKKLKKKAEDKAVEEVSERMKGNRQKDEKQSRETHYPSEEEIVASESIDKDPFTVYTRFDFVSGSDIFFYDDFSAENLGDFPAEWDTNGSGELVEYQEKRWFQLTSGTTYIPIVADGLPEEFTIEFDMYLVNNANNASVARAWFFVDDNTSFDLGENWGTFNIGFWEKMSMGQTIEKVVDGKRVIRNTIGNDLIHMFQAPIRMSIHVKKNRLRAWANHLKIIDVPKLIPDVPMKAFKIRLNSMEEPILISNFKMAKNVINVYESLQGEGVFSTTGIYFDTGSAEIKPNSFGVLKEIAAAVKKGAFQVKIVGHTDSEGSEEANLTLSLQRAEKVKEALVSHFGVDPESLTTEGKGESLPMADNESPEGMAKNRRVEIVRL